MEKEKTISSQVFTKNKKFKILDKISEKKDGKYFYTYKIECIKCGTIKEVDGSHKERTICQECKKLEHIDKFVGQTLGTYTILEFSHESDNNNYYKVKCNNCNSVSIKSIKTIKTSKSCSFCRYEKSHKEPTIEAPRNCVKSTYISGAKNRNLEFSLSDEIFDKLIFSNCYYCGAEISEYKSDLKFNKSNEIFKRNGIDRLDSNIGYTEENCVSCCPTCNLMKMTLHHDDFISHIFKITENLVNKGSTTILKGSTLQVNGNGNGRLLEKEDDIVSSI